MNIFNFECIFYSVNFFCVYFHLFLCVGKLNVLGSLSEDESEESEEDEKESEDEEEEESESEHDEETQEPEKEKEEIVNISFTMRSNVTVEDFLKNPSAENFESLGENQSELLLKEATVS